MSRIRRLLSCPPAPRRAPLALALAAALVALGACTAVASSDGESRDALTAPALPEAVARWTPSSPPPVRATASIPIFSP